MKSLFGRWWRGRTRREVPPPVTPKKTPRWLRVLDEFDRKPDLSPF